jgi:hypothetical protein
MILPSRSSQSPYQRVRGTHKATKTPGLRALVALARRVRVGLHATQLNQGVQILHPDEHFPVALAALYRQRFRIDQVLKSGSGEAQAWGGLSHIEPPVRRGMPGWCRRGTTRVVSSLKVAWSLFT